MTGRAVLRSARISPQKARLVANVVRGRDVSEAIERLAFTRKKAAGMIQKLIESAIANAEHQDDELDIDDLYVETIMVDKGPVLKRFRPRAQGRATKILKKTSHITLVLAVR